MSKLGLERVFGLHTSTSKVLETKPALTEQERLKNQMELLRSRLSQVAQLITHPAFDKYKQSNDWGKGESYLWSISLRPMGDGMVCTTEDLLGHNQHHLMITNGVHGASLSLSTAHEKTGMEFIEASPLKDPVTGEAVSSMHLDFDTQASDVHWLIRALFGGSEFTHQQITLDETTLALDESVPSYFRELGIDPIPMRLYMRTLSAKPDREKKGRVTFETSTNMKVTNEGSWHLMRYGFPDYQDFPIEIEECVPRVDAVIDFIMPALVREIRNYGPATLPQAPAKTRRIGN